MFWPAKTPPLNTGLNRTFSSYGKVYLELYPRPGDLYVMCRDGSFQHWPSDGEALGWEYVAVNNTPHVRVAQFGFQPVEMRMQVMDHTPNIPDGYGTVGNHVQFCTSTADGTIDEQSDDGEKSVVSGSPPVTRRHTTKW